MNRSSINVRYRLSISNFHKDRHIVLTMSNFGIVFYLFYQFYPNKPTSSCWVLKCFEFTDGRIGRGRTDALNLFIVVFESWFLAKPFIPLLENQFWWLPGIGIASDGLERLRQWSWEGGRMAHLKARWCIGGSQWWNTLEIVETGLFTLDGWWAKVLQMMRVDMNVWWYLYI